VLPASASATIDSRARSVNAAGWAVGTRVDPSVQQFGTLWANGVVHDLQALIEEGPPAQVYAAYSSNDAGQITVTGFANGADCALRLDPL